MTLSRNFVSSKKVFIYPNPTSGIIKIASASMSEWTIFNLHGQLLQTGNTNWIDISDQENGLYLLQFENVSQKHTLTIIKK